ncbi:hypothetical protein GQ53DRAFT_152238 [Thozetella sp. PMI_491]|nr:hypothetical protein GQ53DRAFT_152238 [Thozetella sp. PMI_491]
MPFPWTSRRSDEGLGTPQSSQPLKVSRLSQRVCPRIATSRVCSKDWPELALDILTKAEAGRRRQPPTCSTTSPWSTGPGGRRGSATSSRLIAMFLWTLYTKGSLRLDQPFRGHLPWRAHERSREFDVYGDIRRCRRPGCSAAQENAGLHCINICDVCIIMVSEWP